MPAGRFAAKAAAPCVLFAMLVCLLHPAAASYVPGDIYPTVGLTLNGFTFSVNVTAYANASLDVQEISALVSQGDFATAATIYAAGKNSFRNQLPPPVYRIAKAAIARDYGEEDWYVLASNYYPYSNGSENNLYLDAPISAALAGEGDYAPGGPLANVRADIIRAWMLFYPVLYYYHEADAAWVTLRSNSSNIAPAKAESEDAVGCYTAPSVSTGGRVAPGFNPWDVSASVGKYFCTTAKDNVKNQPKFTSKVNVEFRRIALETQRLFTNAASVSPAAFGSLRLAHQRLLNINQVQLTLRSALLAAASTPRDVISNGAAAWAHWRLVEPTLSLPEYGAAPEQLVAIRDMLHPQQWAKVADKSKGRIRAHAIKIAKAIKALTNKAGYNWKKEIAACKLSMI